MNDPVQTSSLCPSPLPSPRARTLRRLLRDDRGLSTVEYIIILMLIAVAGMVLWQNFGKAVADKVGAATQSVEGLPSSPIGN